MVKGWCTETGIEVASTRRAGARRHGLHRGDRRRAALARRAHHHDLRRHHRHPGQRPGRPQDRARRRRDGAGRDRARSRKLDARARRSRAAPSSRRSARSSAAAVDGARRGGRLDASHAYGKRHARGARRRRCRTSSSGASSPAAGRWRARRSIAAKQSGRGAGRRRLLSRPRSRPRASTPTTSAAGRRAQARDRHRGQRACWRSPTSSSDRGAGHMRTVPSRRCRGRLRSSPFTRFAMVRLWNAFLYSMAGLRAAWAGPAIRLEVWILVIAIPLACWLPVDTVQKLLLIGQPGRGAGHRDPQLRDRDRDRPHLARSASAVEGRQGHGQRGGVHRRRIRLRDLDCAARSAHVALRFPAASRRNASPAAAVQRGMKRASTRWSDRAARLLFAGLAALAPMLSADPLAVVAPLPPGTYPVGCSNVEQDFSRIQPGETAQQYWEGFPSGNRERYVDTTAARSGERPAHGDRSSRRSRALRRSRRERRDLRLPGVLSDDRDQSVRRLSPAHRRRRAAHAARRRAADLARFDVALAGAAVLARPDRQPAHRTTISPR